MIVRPNYHKYKSCPEKKYIYLLNKVNKYKSCLGLQVLRVSYSFSQGGQCKPRHDLYLFTLFSRYIYFFSGHDLYLLLKILFF